MLGLDLSSNTGIGTSIGSLEQVPGVQERQDFVTYDHCRFESNITAVLQKFLLFVIQRTCGRVRACIDARCSYACTGGMLAIACCCTVSCLACRCTVCVSCCCAGISSGTYR